MNNESPENNYSTKEQVRETILHEINTSEAEEMIADPRYVVKIKSFKELENLYRNKIDGDFEAVELIEMGSRLFDELSQYHITIPVEYFLYTDANGQRKYIERVSKIDGKNLEERQSLQDISQSVNELYTNLSNYFLDKLKNGESFLTDINGGSQYVYGSKNNEKDSKIYLVDADLYLDNRTKHLLTIVYWLARHLFEAEGKCSGTNEVARNNIREFLKIYQETFSDLGSKDMGRIAELEKFLRGEKFGKKILPAIPIFEKNQE